MSCADAQTLSALIAEFESLTADGVIAGHRPDYEALLGPAGPTTRILDCACACGVEAVALAGSGYAVSASDPSAIMVERARARAAAERRDLPVRHSEWAALDRCFDERFDAVVCAGNALVHASGMDALSEALQGMRRVTKRGGHLVLTSRNWEALRAWQPRVFIPGKWHASGASRVLAMYVWTISKQWSQPHVLEVVVLHDGGDHVTHRHHTVNYHPFRVRDLVDMLRVAGFAHVEIDYTSSLEWYTVVARAT